MKIEDVEVILRALTSDERYNTSGRDSGFRSTIEQALGKEVFGRLHNVEFEDNLDGGIAMSFDFEGESYWLEHIGGGFSSLGRLSGEGDICMVHPESNQFKEEFLNALARDKRIPE